MWIIHPVFIITSCLFLSSLEGTEEALTKMKQASSKGNTVCAVLNPLVYGIICFLATMVLILLILLCKLISARHGEEILKNVPILQKSDYQNVSICIPRKRESRTGLERNERIRGDNINMNTDRGESSPLSQNNALNVCPLSVNGADDSSSTSSESSVGTATDLSSNSQQCVSLQGRRKTSDYINVSEGASSGRVDFKNKKTGKDYVNVKKPHKEVIKGDEENRDDGSNASNASTESVVNYSEIVFTKVGK